MTSTETQVAKEAPPVPKSEANASHHSVNFSIIDLALRVLLFAATITSLVVLVTSKQTVHGPKPRLPFPGKFEAKFTDAPAFIYFLVALAITAFYSIITTLVSLAVIQKPELSTNFLLQFALWDTLIFGVLVSAVGTAGGVAYTGLKGNKHVQWGKVCTTFDKYCRHIGSSLFVALFGSVVLVLLLWFNIFRIHKCIPNRVS